jgi:hypothetical protein
MLLAAVAVLVSGLLPWESGAAVTVLVFGLLLWPAGRLRG